MTWVGTPGSGPLAAGGGRRGPGPGSTRLRAWACSLPPSLPLFAWSGVLAAGRRVRDRGAMRLASRLAVGRWSCPLSLVSVRAPDHRRRVRSVPIPINAVLATIAQVAGTAGLVWYTVIWP